MAHAKAQMHSNAILRDLAARKPHSVDLAGHIEACEMNYHRLLTILPGLREGRNEWAFEAGEIAKLKITIRLRDSAPYTSTVEICQEQKGLVLPAILLRLYHDADVAEVVAFAGHRHWQSRYDYPNPSMYQPDEKQALNRFLAEWLVFCRNHGVVLSNICESVLVSKK